MDKYPLSKNLPHDKIKTNTGKALSDINIENILNGNIKSEDIKISKETLLMQGEIAESCGRPQLNKNFIRASELIDVPDQLILKIYEALRPNRSTKAELLNIAGELESKYRAYNCSKLVREAVEVYEKRGILKLEV